MTTTRPKRRRHREQRRPGDTDRVRALVAAPRYSTLDAVRAQTPILRWLVERKLQRVHPVTGEPTGGAYPDADTSPLPRPTWGVPADACMVLRSFAWPKGVIMTDWLVSFSDIRDEELDGSGALRNGKPVWRLAPAAGRASNSLRAVCAKPLPDWLAVALWQRCPRFDAHDNAVPWRWTDTLSEDDAARLEGQRIVTSTLDEIDRWTWLKANHPYVRDATFTATTKTLTWTYYPNGRGIPELGNARIAPGQGGRMLALVEATCEACSGRGEVEVSDHVAEHVYEPGGASRCTACAGRGTVPLAAIGESEP